MKGLRLLSLLVVWLVTLILSSARKRPAVASPLNRGSNMLKPDKDLDQDLRRMLSADSLDAPSCYKPRKFDYLSPAECAQQMFDAGDNPPNPCITDETELVYVNGVFSADQTFYNCLANVPDSASMASFYDGKYHGCWVYMYGLTLLNLVKVDEVSGVSVLQVTVSIRWLDYRFHMPLFWEKIEFSYTGIDLNHVFANDSVIMWKPQLTFPDASEVNMLSDSFTMNYVKNTSPTTAFVYEATFALTLVQPDYDFQQYPNDRQTISIRSAMLNYDSEQLQLFPDGIYCSYLSNDLCSFSQNPIWTWEQEYDTCTSYADKKEGSLIWPSYVVFNINVARQGEGVIVRLVFPIAFLLLLSAVTFWLSFENRIDTTITLLLSVSALYIVILQNIPMVGYLTNVDKFVFVMFIVLVIVVVAHQVYGTLQLKMDRWPLRKIYMRLIEMTGRVALFPIIIGYFLYNVSLQSYGTELFLVIAMGWGSCYFFITECRSIGFEWKRVLQQLLEKVNRPDITLREVSWVEKLVLNYIVFKTISVDSLDLSKMLHEKGEIKIPEEETPMELRKSYEVREEEVRKGGDEKKDGSIVVGTGKYKGVKADRNVELSTIYPNSRVLGENPSTSSKSREGLYTRRIGKKGEVYQQAIPGDPDDDYFV